MKSAAEAATEIGASKRTVTRLCKQHGVGRFVGRQLVLSDDDIARLRGLFAGRAGNPEMQHRLGQNELTKLRWGRDE